MDHKLTHKWMKPVHKANYFRVIIIFFKIYYAILQKNQTGRNSILFQWENSSTHVILRQKKELDIFKVFFFKLSNLQNNFILEFYHQCQIRYALLFWRRQITENFHQVKSLYTELRGKMQPTKWQDQFEKGLQYNGMDSTCELSNIVLFISHNIRFYIFQTGLYLLL